MHPKLKHVLGVGSAAESGRQSEGPGDKVLPHGETEQHEALQREQDGQPGGDLVSGWLQVRQAHHQSEAEVPGKGEPPAADDPNPLGWLPSTIQNTCPNIPLLHLRTHDKVPYPRQDHAKHEDVQVAQWMELNEDDEGVVPVVEVAIPVPSVPVEGLPQRRRKGEGGHVGD